MGNLFRLIASIWLGEVMELLWTCEQLWRWGPGCSPLFSCCLFSVQTHPLNSAQTLPIVPTAKTTPWIKNLAEDSRIFYFFFFFLLSYFSDGMESVKNWKEEFLWKAIIHDMNSVQQLARRAKKRGSLEHLAISRHRREMSLVAFVLSNLVCISFQHHEREM